MTPEEKEKFEKRFKKIKTQNQVAMDELKKCVSLLIKDHEERLINQISWCMSLHPRTIKRWLKK